MIRLFSYNHIMYFEHIPLFPVILPSLAFAHKCTHIHMYLQTSTHVHTHSFNCFALD